MANKTGYNGEKRTGVKTPLKHHFNTENQQAIEKFRKGESLTEEEDNLLLSTVETAEVLSIRKGEQVTTRYIPQLVRLGKLEPVAPGSGRSYLYRMGQARQVTFRGME